MKKSMELEIEINKLRQQALADDASLETIAEIRSAVEIATQKRTVALEIEGAEQEAAEAKVAEQRESEGHQDVETRGAAGIHWYCRESRNSRLPASAYSRHEGFDRVGNASAEFRAAIYGQDIGSEWMPLEMLLTAEERAATSLTAIQENQGNIAGAGICAGRCRVSWGISTDSRRWCCVLFALGNGRCAGNRGRRR